MNKIFKIVLQGAVTRESGLNLDGMLEVIESLDEDVRETAVLMMLGEYVKPKINETSTYAENAKFLSFNPLKSNGLQVRFSYQIPITEYAYFNGNSLSYSEATEALKNGTFVPQKKEEAGVNARSIEIPTGKFRQAKRYCSLSSWQK